MLVGNSECHELYLHRRKNLLLPLDFTSSLLEGRTRQEESLVQIPPLFCPPSAQRSSLYIELDKR